MEGSRPVYSYKLEKGITADRHGMVIINNEGVLDILRSSTPKTAGGNGGVLAWGAIMFLTGKKTLREPKPTHQTKPRVCYCFFYPRPPQRPHKLSTHNIPQPSFPTPHS